MGYRNRSLSRRAVRYNARSIPGCALSIAEHGANCQRFAYAVIRHYGCEIADFRSRELWEDDTFTCERWRIS
ncbi:hypothetical protein [Rhodomicrobium vannielii]|uniref:hypothetical protein n=1 Tax=Rhodomicrobium vannielii TaxID=1069 RepID=UPI0002F939BF|nr:hypothetical protein [Rhodomicrobium vannielii]